jgi:hypothetical protein
VRVLLAILCFLAGAAIIAASGIALIAEQGVQNYLQAETRGDIPGSAKFTAEEGRYNVLLNLRNRLNRRVFSSYVNNARCEARLADGTVKRMNGQTQGTSVSGVAPTIGAFEAVAGPTEVRCAWDRERDQLGQFTVAPVNETLRLFAFVGIGIGVAIVLLGFWLLFRRKGGPAGPVAPSPPPPMTYRRPG